MENYHELVRTVRINKQNHLMGYGDSLIHIGTGRSAFVFRIKSTTKAMKVYFPAFSHIAKEEAEIYEKLLDIDYYPSVYTWGQNYIVMDYIEGLTLFDCLIKGKMITPSHMNKIDHALSLAIGRGLNPSDIHLRNILVNTKDEIKIIDVARFRQMKDCRQWDDLKKAYRQFYSKRFFSGEIPAALLNGVAWLYKKGWIPSYKI